MCWNFIQDVCKSVTVMFLIMSYLFIGGLVSEETAEFIRNTSFYFLLITFGYIAGAATLPTRNNLGSRRFFSWVGLDPLR